MLDAQIETRELKDGPHDAPPPDAAAMAEELANVSIGINAVSLMSPLTGIGQYTWQLLKQMQMLKLAPWMFYGTGWSREIRAGALPGIGAAKNLFKRIVPRPYVAMRFLLSRRFAAGTRRHKIRLYHDPNFMAYRFGGPTIVTIHDLSWVRYPETHPPERVREMNRLMPDIVRQAEHILVVSDFVRREVIDYYGFAPERVTTTRNGVAPDFRPMREDECRAALAAYGLTFGSYMLAVGTLEPRKNLSSVIAAFGSLPEPVRRRYPLVIAGMVGWGEDRYSKELRELIRRGEARMAGYVPQAALPALYAGARMLLYPSLYEGFGLPPLEAMASGVPAIVSNCASLPEVVGEAGLQVEPLDVAAIAENMRRLVEDDGLHRRLALAGRQRALGFSWRTCALETLEVYRKAAARL
ncbi:MAG TPA: glycosyltransferase family 1 protein [Paucimonas sp.]|nr:glycosyltransferase family 1 protein [Paucimonas sp.]